MRQITLEAHRLSLTFLVKPNAKSEGRERCSCWELTLAGERILKEAFLSHQA